MRWFRRFRRSKARAWEMEGCEFWKQNLTRRQSFFADV